MNAIPHTLSSETNIRRVTFTVGLFFAAVVLALWILLDIQRDQETHDRIANEAERQTFIISEDLRVRFSTLQRFVRRWAIHKTLTRTQFTADAKTLLDDFPGFQGLGWVDSEFYVRWMTPLEANKAAIGFFLAFEERRKVALETARDSNTPMMTQPIDLVQGGKGVIIYLPIYVDDQFQGLLGAVFRINLWLEHILQRLDTVEKFGTSITINGEGVYTHPPKSDSEFRRWAAKSTHQFLNHTIEATVVPNANVFESNRDFMAEWLSFFTVVLGFMSTTLVYMTLRTQAARQDAIGARDRLEVRV